MSHEVNVHATQTAILRELLFRPSAGFTDLQKPTGLSSDHFSFHINRLQELGLVEKTDKKGHYRLTARGKEYANRLDTDNNTVERQPKSAVLLAIERTVNGQKQYVFQERLKQPYYGFWGLPSGKLRWGETIIQGAARELLEETGFTADLVLKGVYHEHAYQQESGELLEDKLFFVVKATNPLGNFIEDFEGGKNSWMTIEQARSQAKIFGSFDIELDIATGKQTFVEEKYAYPNDQF